MAKRYYGLAKGAGVFYDNQTKLKVLPGQAVQLDTDNIGTRTEAAIKGGHLEEVEKPKEEKAEKGKGAPSGDKDQK